MSYKILYTQKAVKNIRKLDPVVRKKISKHIERYSLNPLLYAHKITDAKAGQYRWRAGNYRVIFDISGKTVYILKARHRRDIYKK